MGTKYASVMKISENFGESTHKTLSQQLSPLRVFSWKFSEIFKTIDLNNLPLQDRLNHLMHNIQKRILQQMSHDFKMSDHIQSCIVGLTHYSSMLLFHTSLLKPRFKYNIPLIKFSKLFWCIYY